MRATCARVLAAALMTGAIATVVGMSALFDTPREAGRALVVPPSSLQRTVRLRVPPAHRRARAAERLVSAHTSSSAQSRPVLVIRTLVRHTTVVRQIPQRRRLAAVKPKPTPPVQPAPPPAPPQPATPPPAPVAPVDARAKGDEGDDQSNEHGNDHGQGKGHEHGNGHEEHDD